jgi:hypothetical protein
MPSRLTSRFHVSSATLMSRQNHDFELNNFKQGRHMSEGYDWVPFYDEMARALLAYRGRQTALVTILKTAASEVWKMKIRKIVRLNSPRSTRSHFWRC